MGQGIWVLLVTGLTAGKEDSNLVRVASKAYGIHLHMPAGQYSNFFTLYWSSSVPISQTRHEISRKVWQPRSHTNFPTKMMYFLLPMGDFADNQLAGCGFHLSPKARKYCSDANVAAMFLGT